MIRTTTQSDLKTKRKKKQPLEVRNSVLRDETINTPTLTVRKLLKMGEDVSKEKLKRHTRGNSIAIKSIKDKKLKRNLEHVEKEAKFGAIRALKWELLLPEEKGYIEEEGMEKSYKVRQEDLKNYVDQQTLKKAFYLKLEHFGPYRVNYARNGRHLLIGGRKGHVSAFDWTSGKLSCEMHLKETVRDITWLHNETLFAVAQRKYVYIYDSSGMEVHVLRKHIDPQRLSFLPYHFLLASVGHTGYLKYQDVSTGELVAEHRTGLGCCNVMRCNPYNAVMCLGHYNGVVTMWTPNMTSAIVKSLCHRGPINALAIDARGLYLTTAGLDGKMKIWDIRTYKLLQEYFTRTPAASLDVSQTGLLGVSYGPHVQIWKDAFITKQKAPYMNELYAGRSIENVCFVPFEDVLGVGYESGIASMIVPGSGEANFDALEVNPYATVKQRQEMEVKALLEKIPAALITLDPHSISRMDKAPHKVIAQEQKREFEANNPNLKFKQAKKKSRGRNSATKRLCRKQSNVIDSNRKLLQEKMENEKMTQKQKVESDGDASVLKRFFSKKKHVAY